MQSYKVPPLPEITVGGYLKDAFLSLGMARDGALSWQEIESFSRLTGDISEPWEAHTVRAMSIAYLDGQRLGEDPLAISPMENDQWTQPFS